MQEEFINLLRFSHDKGIVLNEKKTKLMHLFPSKMPRIDPKIIYHSFHCLHTYAVTKSCTGCNTSIELVDIFRYLGIQVENKLIWHEQINSVLKKLRKAAYILHHLKYCSNRNILQLIYYSLAESYMRYGISAWGSATGTKKLQKMQMRLFKIIGISETKFLNVSNIYKLTLVNLFYEEKQYSVKIDHDIQTRRKTEGRFKVRKWNNVYGKFSLPILIPTLMNELPVNLLEIKPEMRRKTALKKHYIPLNTS